MNTTVKIILLHIIMLATQALYMYISNRAQMKSILYYYILAIPFVAIIPVVLNNQDPNAYSIYEYTIIFCIFGAAIADVVMAAIYSREYLTDSSGRRFFCSYLMICTAASFCGSIGVPVRLAMAMTLAAAVLVFTIIKKVPALEVLKAVPLALLSFTCSWVFVQYIS